MTEDMGRRMGQRSPVQDRRPISLQPDRQHQAGPCSAWASRVGVIFQTFARMPEDSDRWVR